MHNILIVEDNKQINDLVSLYVSQDGHKVFSAYTAEDGLKLFEENDIDLVVTDLMLPKMSGEDLVKRIRTKSDCFIIILTAKIHIDNKLHGLSLGADDYIIKPFSTEELLLKIKNFLKRKTAKQKGNSFYSGELIVEDNNNIVKFNGSELELTANEFLILNHLSKNSRQIFSREQLLDQCFGSDSDVIDRIIDVYIKNIRKKLNEDTKNPRYIKTIYGLGYMFVGEADD